VWVGQRANIQQTSDLRGLFAQLVQLFTACLTVRKMCLYLTRFGIRQRPIEIRAQGS